MRNSLARSQFDSEDLCEDATGEVRGATSRSPGALSPQWVRRPAFTKLSGRAWLKLSVIASFTSAAKLVELALLRPQGAGASEATSGAIAALGGLLAAIYLLLLAMLSAGLRGRHTRGATLAVGVAFLAMGLHEAPQTLSVRALAIISAWAVANMLAVFAALRAIDDASMRRLQANESGA